MDRYVFPISLFITVIIGVIITYQLNQKKPTLRYLPALIMFLIGVATLFAATILDYGWANLGYFIIGAFVIMGSLVILFFALILQLFYHKKD